MTITGSKIKTKKLTRILLSFADNNYQAMQAVFYHQSYNPVFTAPASMRHTADKIHSEGYDLELPCKAIGALPIKYSWKINGEPFKRKYRLNIRNSGTMMKIRRIRTTDSGVYTCIASNKYGNLSFSFPLKIKGNVLMLIYRLSKKSLAFEKTLLPEYQSNDIEKCLVLFPTCPIRFRNLPSLSLPLIPVSMGRFLQKSPFKSLQKASENSKQNFPLFFFLE